MNNASQLERWILFGILIIYLALAVGFSSGPIFEGPDEIDHYGYGYYLLHHRKLPNPYELPKGEYHQPPLYYSIVAPIVGLAGDADPEPYRERANPFFGHLFGVLGNDNKNVYLHERQERFPYQDNNLARTVHITRLVSVTMGLCTVIASYTTYSALWPDRPDRRLLGTAMVAFMPQFVYLSGYITNDILLVLLATLTLLLTVQQICSGPTWQKSLLLGLVLGAAQLVKVNAAVLVVPVGLAIILDRRLWRYAPVIAGAALIVSGWWFARNILLYGDLTGMQVYFDIWQDQINADHSISTVWWAYQMQFVHRTFWARFGYNSVGVAGAIYRFYDALLLIASAGIIVALVKIVRSVWGQPRLADRTTLTLMAVVVVFTAVWILSVSYSASIAWFLNQGRFLLPGVVGLGAIIGLGISALSPKVVRFRVAISMVLVLASIASVTLVGYFIPSYRPSPIKLEIERPLALRYGDTAELIGMSPAVPRSRPGEIAEITLYWRALNPSEQPLRMYLHNLESGPVWRDSYPATGNLLSTDWRAGETWQETWHIAVPLEVEPQTAYQLVAGLYDLETGETLPVTADGLETIPYVGQFSVMGEPATYWAAYRFGELIGLAEPEVSWDREALRVCLDWIALEETDIDYHLFVHVRSVDGVLYDQYDSSLSGGRYPSSVWTVGEGINECVSFNVDGLPEDGGEIGLGLYDLSTGVRLTLIDEDSGQHLQDDMLRLPVSP